MITRLNFILFVFLFFISCRGLAQLGGISGIVKDTANNSVLTAATVSLYRDSTLVSYQLTNSFGAFTFKNVPLKEAYMIIVSYTGYSNTKREFILEENNTNLSVLAMSRKTIGIEEVNISVPPVTMNGDTLEFNASAFRMDRNAVVEELMRKIENITVWGDGKITVNGREVKQLLVNGKPFFSNDPIISTQNLPKNAIDKIQVYSQNEKENGLQDSSLIMNLKLKKESEKGYFGKIGGGFGTLERYESNGMFNIYSPRLQLAVAAATNNTNKLATSVEEILKNNTFKGVGAHVDLMPDFFGRGIHKIHAAGVNIKYDINKEKGAVLNSDYFVQSRVNNSLSNTSTITELENDVEIRSEYEDKNDSRMVAHKMKQSLTWLLKDGSLTITQSISDIRRDEKNETFRQTIGENDQINSFNNNVRDGQEDNLDYSVNLSYQYRDKNNSEKFYDSLIANYLFSSNNSSRDNISQTDFKSFVDVRFNRNIKRELEDAVNQRQHQLELVLPNLHKAFGQKKLNSGFSILLKNKFSLREENTNTLVNDLDTVSNIFINNGYLTNASMMRLFNETLGLTINKVYVERLRDRYYKSLAFSLEPKMSFIFQENRSDKTFQFIYRSYTAFVPTASVVYSHFRFGKSRRTISLNFLRETSIPTVQQIAPLTDSTDMYYLYLSNPRLKASFKNEISVTFSGGTDGKKNALIHRTSFQFGQFDNRHTDSIFVDQQNIRRIYVVNTDGYKYVSANSSVEKSIKFKQSELQVNLQSNVRLHHVPGFVNNSSYQSKLISSGAVLNIFYRYRDIIAIDIGEDVSASTNLLSELNGRRYNNVNLKTSLKTGLKLSKLMYLNNNIDVNSFRSSGAEKNNSTIWNAVLTYRILKGHNGEIKFSAFDILRQNKNIFINNMNNMQTIRTTNVLQGYFMLSLSYFPRQFGLKK